MSDSIQHHTDSANAGGQTVHLGSIHRFNLYILLRIRARPACDQPLYSNGDRVACRTDNSVAALLELTPETGRGQGFNPAPFRPRTIRAG